METVAAQGCGGAPLMLRAAIYCRVSTAGQEAGTSLESQRDACRRLAEEIGATVVAEYQDVDSGAKEEIPGLMALQDAAQGGLIDVVLVDHPDRFSRNLAKKVVVRADLLRAGVDIRYVALQIEDSPEGRFFENMTAVVAEYERERITFRMRRGRYAKAQRGQVVGVGPAPYGYGYVRDGERVVGLTPDPVTARVVQRIFTLFQTMTGIQIADQFNAEGIPAPRGSRWWQASVTKMIHNTVYKGWAAFGQSDRTDGGYRPRTRDEWILSPVPPLVDEELWDAAQRASHERTIRRRGRLPDDAYLLRGMVTCGHCGGALASSAINEHRYYVCLRKYGKTADRQGRERCILPGALAEGLEALVMRTVRSALMEPDTIRQSLAVRLTSVNDERTQRRTTIEADLFRQRRRLQQAMDIVLETDPSTETYRDLRRRMADAQAAISRLQEEERKLDDDSRSVANALETMETVGAAYRERIETLTRAEWRVLFDELGIRPILRYQPGGTRLGRRKLFDIDLRVQLSLQLPRSKSTLENAFFLHGLSLPLVAGDRKAV